MHGPGRFFSSRQGLWKTQRAEQIARVGSSSLWMSRGIRADARPVRGTPRHRLAVRGFAAGARGTDNMVKRKLGLWRMPMEPQGEEGRDKLRKAAGRSTCPLIRG